MRIPRRSKLATYIFRVTLHGWENSAVSSWLFQLASTTIRWMHCHKRLIEPSSLNKEFIVRRREELFSRVAATELESLLEVGSAQPHLSFGLGLESLPEFHWT